MGKREVKKKKTIGNNGWLGNACGGELCLPDSFFLFSVFCI